MLINDKNLSDKTIQGMFEEQVEKFSNNIAVEYEDIHLTYSELNARSNQLAHFIRKSHDVRADTLIVLCLDRSEHMLIGILGALKSGAAYVPIDASYPDERIRYILQDTGTQIILTNRVHKDRLSNILQDMANKIEIIAIDEERVEEVLNYQSEENVITKTSSCDLAYVIYTSGTTGNPKGVMIEHKAYSSLIDSIKSLYFSDKNSVKTYSITNYVFDIFGLEYGLPLLSGGCITLGDKDFSLLNCRDYDFVQMTPSLCDIKLDHLVDVSHTKLLIGGEKLNEDLLTRILDRSITVVNVYGPTETTIWSTSKMYEKIEGFEPQLSIGKPLANEKTYIVGDNHQLLPVGAIGELYIGGVGLARGYLNQVELTKEKFITNPFQTEEEKEAGRNGRLYKTGDLVRWLPDGDIEYIGRNDFQVKIRGYRIELGEIESVLSRYDGIKQCVVLAKEHQKDVEVPGNKYLVAYYVKNLIIREEDNKLFIKTWKSLYQEQYFSLDILNYKQNTSVWISSYTDKAINKEDMLEWVDSTIARIRTLNPKVIFEIGSGSGLILFNMIDNIEHYLATDLSENAINYTRDVINKFEYGDKISLFACSADNVPYKRFQKSYDTVVINSVSQYFPNLEYLDNIINNAIKNMKKDGYIFIGDVRDYRLLECFHYSVQKYKKGQVTQSEVEYFSSRDKELLVSPNYFINLNAINPLVSYVEIMPKLGNANHEMNNYRYDVILHINREEKEIYNINEEDFLEVSDVENYIKGYSGNDLLLIKYKNKRIIEDYVEYISI